MQQLSRTHQKLAHKLVADTAKEMAGAFYEDAARDNAFYKHYPSQNFFVNREHHRFIDMAKQQLSLMLGRNDIPEWQKEIIFDALVKHASLPGNIDRRVAHMMLDQDALDKQIARVVH